MLDKNGLQELQKAMITAMQWAKTTGVPQVISPQSQFKSGQLVKNEKSGAIAEFICLYRNPKSSLFSYIDKTLVKARRPNGKLVYWVRYNVKDATPIDIAKHRKENAGN